MYLLILFIALLLITVLFGNVSPEEISCNDSPINKDNVERMQTILVINLRDKLGDKRRSKLNKEASLHGIQIHYINAVNKRDLDHDSLRSQGHEIRQIDGHRDLRLHEYAAALSHQKIYQNMIDDNIQMAIIGEDDVEFCPNFVYRIQQLLVLIENLDFDIVKLEYCNQNLATADDAIELIKGEGGACSACYLISQGGARLLSDANTPVWMNADGIMDPNHLKSVGKTIKQYYMKPPLARQNQQLEKYR